jgi:hypothetical protein
MQDLEIFCSNFPPQLLRPPMREPGNPFFLLAGALLFDKKIRQSAALFWFGLRVVGILQIFYTRAILQRTIVDSPAFLERGFVENLAVCAHTTHLPKK